MTLQEFKPLLEKQQQSSLTQKEFCECYDIKVATFSYWKRKVALEQAETSPFIDITPTIPNSPSEKIEIQTPTGYTILLPYGAYDLSCIINTLGE